MNASRPLVLERSVPACLVIKHCSDEDVGDILQPTPLDSQTAKGFRESVPAKQ